MGIIRFGTRGWRARYGEGFDASSVARIAEALAVIWSDTRSAATILVGYDTRRDACELADVAAGVLAAAGLHVKVSDRPCPLPALGWNLAQDATAVGGIMITASEAPAEYGGMILRMADGSPATRIFMDEVEELISPTVPTELGTFEHADLMTAYLADIAGKVDSSLIADAHLKVLVDPMYGAASGSMAELLRGMGCEVLEIHSGPAEDFGGIHPDPTEPWVDECERGVLSHSADFGLVFDGDADRSTAVDDRGVLLAPKTFVPLLMDHLVTDRHESGRIVATISCSASIKTQAERLGLDMTETPVGFSRLYNEMWDGDVLLATEEYGGICMPSHFPERDGLLGALLLVEYVAARRKRLSELVDELDSEIGLFFYGRRDVRLDYGAIESFRLLLPGLNPPSVGGKVPCGVSHGDGLKLTFADGSWSMVRPSRTEPTVRVYAEAHTAKERDALLKSSVHMLESF
ncbi:MAG: phosphoglucomutase [Atopobiaceae bacterium]